jgi:hypothetical protein
MSDVFHDRPLEVLNEYFTNTGSCDAQTITPRQPDPGQPSDYQCHCSCGRWEVIVPDRQSGLAAAREHTRELTERELAKRASGRERR